MWCGDKKSTCAASRTSTTLFSSSLFLCVSLYHSVMCTHFAWQLCSSCRLLVGSVLPLCPGSDRLPIMVRVCANRAIRDLHKLIANLSLLSVTLTRRVSVIAFVLVCGDRLLNLIKKQKLSSGRQIIIPKRTRCTSLDRGIPFYATHWWPLPSSCNFAHNHFTMQQAHTRGK